MGSWRRRLVAAMGDELGRARGEARLLAERTAARAEAERARAELVIGDADRKQTQLRNIHKKMIATLEARRTAAVERAHEAAMRAATDAAPAAAGAQWTDWKPESGLSRGPAPLLRIGRIAGSAVRRAGQSSPSPSPCPPATTTSIPGTAQDRIAASAPAAAGVELPAGGRIAGTGPAASQLAGGGPVAAGAEFPADGRIAGAGSAASGGQIASPGVGAATAGSGILSPSPCPPTATTSIPGTAQDRIAAGGPVAAGAGGPAAGWLAGGESAAVGDTIVGAVASGGPLAAGDTSAGGGPVAAGDTIAGAGAAAGAGVGVVSPSPCPPSASTSLSSIAVDGTGVEAGRAAASGGLGSVVGSGSAVAGAVDVALASAGPGVRARGGAGDAALLTGAGSAGDARVTGAVGADAVSFLSGVDAGEASVTGGYDNSGLSVIETSLPALIPLLDRSHLRIDSGAAQALPGILLRAVGAVPAGLVRLHVYDPEHLGGSLSAFAALGKAGLLSFVGPSGLREELDSLVETVRRVNAEVLAGEHDSLAALAAATGRRPEPWRVLVLLNADLAAWPAHDQAQLARLRRTGVAAGVHLVIVGDDDAGPADLPRLTATSATALPGAPLELDSPPPARTITKAAKHIAEKHRAGKEPARLVDLLPQRLWSASSAAGLQAPIGETAAGEAAKLSLGDNPPHALVGGPSGSGKTNLLYAWIAGLASHYSPDELALYLLDFKEGVSFARFASGRRDPTWLPHVRLVGVNINDDREFGLALLRHLKDELRRRAEAAKAHEATKLEELRAADPGGRWPRIVAIVDEFQVLLEARDAVTDEAVQLLEDLARRGRSQGIHLVLASQDIAGIEALWGRPSLVAQFTLRIALPKARRVLAENNHAADTVPRFHAVVNDESGHTGANRIVAIPNAGHADAWEPLQQRLWEARPAGNEPPVLFDGDLVPELHADAPAAETALLGQTIDVASRGAELALHRAPGRNLAVLGTRTTEAADILAAAALTAALGSRERGQRIGVDLCCLEPDAASPALALAAALEAEGADVDWHDDLASACKDWESRCDGTLRLNLVYAVDAGSARLDAAGAARLRRMLLDGPERHLHTLGWWRSVPRLREDLGGFSARFDAVDAWLALDVQGPELAPLSPGSGGPAWYPRVRRGLYFDRARHRAPQVVIPYRTTAMLPNPSAVLDRGAP